MALVTLPNPLNSELPEKGGKGLGSSQKTARNVTRTHQKIETTHGNVPKIETRALPATRGDPANDAGLRPSCGGRGGTACAGF